MEELMITFVGIFTVAVTVTLVLAILILWLASPFLIGRKFPIEELGKSSSILVAACLIYPFSFVGVLIYILLWYIMDGKNKEKNI